jgi:hypothetical protein
MKCAFCQSDLYSLLCYIQGFHPHGDILSMCGVDW